MLDYYCSDCGQFTKDDVITDGHFILCPRCGKEIGEIE